MRNTVAALCSALVFLLATTAQASETVECVQRQLTALALDPGPVDGSLGTKTRNAARALVTRHSELAQLPELSEAYAFRWCKAIASVEPSVEKIYREVRGSDLPAFDPSFNLRNARKVWLFDVDYYIAHVKDPAVTTENARDHYNKVGWKLGYDPSLMFDTSAYLEANPDVAASGENPFFHYINKGMDEYRGFGKVADTSGFIFDIGPGVTAKQVALIKEGLTIAQDYLSRAYDRPLPAEIAALTVVKLEATGRGNQEKAARGGNATGLSNQNDRLPRPYFDVAHRDFNQDTSGRGWTRRAEQLAMVVHEFVHGWMAWQDVATTYEQPLGDWLNEGIANYIGWNAVADLGLVSIDDYRMFQARAARDSTELSRPLAAYGTSQSPVWAGHIGYIAVDLLVLQSPNSEQSIKILIDEMIRARATNGSVRQAFLAAFGIELSDFYRQFEPWRKAMLANPRRVRSGRPTLILDD